MGHQRPLYDEDYHAWLMDQAASLRAAGSRIGTAIDADTVAEELEDMGKAQRQALNSHLKVLYLHLLKWLYQPDHRKGGWRVSIRNARDEIQTLLDDSPSLRRFVEEIAPKAYLKARGNAADETGLPMSTFPEEAPFTLLQALDDEYMPD
ncbi:MAG: DUF29 domain-containing protein [Caenispirillum bisanense]|nr:DUF29 domain-containing protein [Caenispirillum bisanense]MCA1973125.1 DUF29 domain-containing protein [Caenispirillum sp.]